MRVFFWYTAVLGSFLGLCLIALYILKSYFIYDTVFRLFIALEYILIAIFFVLNIKSKRVNKVIFYSTFPFILFCIYDYLTKQDSFSFYPQVVECIIFIFIITYLFYEKMNTDLSIPIYNLPVFWIAFGFLIYFSGSFFLFLFSKNFGENSEFKRLYHLIYGTVTITKNLLLCIGIYSTKFIIAPITSSDQIVNLDLDPFNTTDKLKKV